MASLRWLFRVRLDQGSRAGRSCPGCTTRWILDAPPALQEEGRSHRSDRSCQERGDLHGGQRLHRRKSRPEVGSQHRGVTHQLKAAQGDVRTVAAVGTSEAARQAVAVGVAMATWPPLSSDTLSSTGASPAAATPMATNRRKASHICQVPLVALVLACRELHLLLAPHFEDAVSSSLQLRRGVDQVHAGCPGPCHHLQRTIRERTDLGEEVVGVIHASAVAVFLPLVTLKRQRPAGGALRVVTGVDLPRSRVVLGSVALRGAVRARLGPQAMHDRLRMAVWPTTLAGLEGQHSANLHTLSARHLAAMPLQCAAHAPRWSCDHRIFGREAASLLKTALQRRRE
mmetsp:Transcript_26230/g.59160  ORF Transcript_26230/g.59160 Transcript_26230/m.59160 type:complete len:342 (-) Transcript_26230:20-1045(-)